MKIKLLCRQAHEGAYIKQGEVVDWPKEQARAAVEAGNAVEVSAPRKKAAAKKG